MFVDLLSSFMFYSKRHTVFVNDEDDISYQSLNETLIPADAEDSAALGSSKKTRTNLNMMSAFTHVGGDTLRTLSVFVAALIATLTNISSTITDAWAAVAVTVTCVSRLPSLVHV